MNFLEAFDELDSLNEANLAQQFNGLFNFNGECPGCGDKFDDENAVATHILGCDKAKKLLSRRSAIIKVNKSGQSFDSLNNISAWAFMKYVNERTECELCHKSLADIKDRRPDHKQLSRSSQVQGIGTGSFRGVLCNDCNTLLGKVEKLSEKSKPGIDVIKDYLVGAREKIAQFNNQV